MWQQLESGRVTHRFEGVVLVATLAVLPVLAIETDVNSRSGWQDLAKAMNWLIWTVFVAELVFILSVAPRKRAALRAHWLDTFIVITTVPLFSSWLASMRFLRLARLLRLLRLSALLTRILERERALTSKDAFRFAALVTVLIVVAAGAAEWMVDHGQFGSIGLGMWWAAVTVTTVGYGDVAPTSVAGRVVAVIVMFVGIGFLSVLTATIASRFVKQERSEEHDELMEALNRLQAEIAEVKQQLARS